LGQAGAAPTWEVDRVGTFILTPTPAAPVSRDQCMIAVALVDQLGATLAAHDGT
jgi:hypothetical protein